jgi:hypothetical protein
VSPSKANTAQDNIVNSQAMETLLLNFVRNSSDIYGKILRYQAKLPFNDSR